MKYLVILNTPSDCDFPKETIVYKPVEAVNPEGAALYCIYDLARGGNSLKDFEGTSFTIFTENLEKIEIPLGYSLFVTAFMYFSWEENKLKTYSEILKDFVSLPYAPLWDEE